MIAFDIKFEKPTTISYLLICISILTDFFHITHITSDITAANREKSIQEICSCDESDGSTQIEEIHKANCSNDNSSYQHKTDNDGCHVIGRLLFYGYIFLCKIGIANVEEHISESVGYSLVARHKNVGIHWLWWLYTWYFRCHDYLGIGGLIVLKLDLYLAIDLFVSLMNALHDGVIIIQLSLQRKPFYSDIKV